MNTTVSPTLHEQKKNVEIRGCTQLHGLASRIGLFFLSFFNLIYRQCQRWIQFLIFFQLLGELKSVLCVAIGKDKQEQGLVSW